MAAGVKFTAEVTSVQVKIKKVKDEPDQRVGKLTLEFDGESVDVSALADLIHGREVSLQVDDTQRSLLRPMQDIVDQDGSGITKITATVDGQTATLAEREEEPATEAEPVEA